MSMCSSAPYATRQPPSPLLSLPRSLSTSSHVHTFLAYASRGNAGGTHLKSVCQARTARWFRPRSTSGASGPSSSAVSEGSGSLTPNEPPKDGCPSSPVVDGNPYRKTSLNIWCASYTLRNAPTSSMLRPATPVHRLNQYIPVPPGHRPVLSTWNPLDRRRSKVLTSSEFVVVGLIAACVSLVVKRRMP